MTLQNRYNKLSVEMIKKMIMMERYTLTEIQVAVFEKYGTGMGTVANYLEKLYKIGKIKTDANGVIKNVHVDEKGSSSEQGDN